MNFKTWGRAKFNTFMVFSFLFYYFISVVIPVIYIIERFDLFIKSESVGKFTGLAIVLVVVGLIELLKRSKDLFKRLPDETKGQATFKYICEGCFSLIFPVGVLLAILMLKIDWTFYSHTIVVLMITQIVAIIFDTFVMKFVYKEIRQRKDASRFNEMEDRREMMKK